MGNIRAGLGDCPATVRRSFKSDAGEVAPEDSELPLLRYMFVHHVRNFPFLDRAKEKEFWQDKLQTVSKPAIIGQAQADS
jgi:hypothetical protein